MKMGIKLWVNDENIVYQVEKLIHEFLRRGNYRENCKLIMHPIMLERIRYLISDKMYIYQIGRREETLFGIRIEEDERMEPFMIEIISKDIRDVMLESIWENNRIKFGVDMGGYYMRLPKRVCFNKKATVLLWNDDTKTITQCDDKDEFDPVIGFLYAYFYKHSGMSKIKAKKYLDEVKSNYENIKPRKS